MNKSVAIYCRVSTDEQGKGYSLQTQLEGCRAQILANGDAIVAEFSEDYTGTVLDRPELDKVRTLARQCNINTLVVYELDRLARGMVKQILLEEEFAKLGVAVEYVLTEYDDTPEGRLQKNVRAVIAEYEREKFIERSFRGKKGRAKAGHVNPGRVTRYGFTYVSDPNGHKGTYVINDEEAIVVRLIYNWYVFGDENGRRMGANRIAKRLSEMQIPTRYDTEDMNGKLPIKKLGRGHWAESSVREIICSEIYTGKHYYNRINRKHGAGESRIKDRSEWIALDVPAIVSRELWEQAQQRRDANKKNATRNTRHPYLLRGRMRCSTCGYIMGCRTDLRFDQPRPWYVCNGGKTIYYKGDLKTPICRGNVRSAPTDEAIWNAIKGVLQSPQIIIDAMQHKADENEAAVAFLRDRLAIAEEQLASYVAQRQRLLNLYLDGEFPKDLLDDKMAEINDMTQRFEAEITTLHKQVKQIAPAFADVESVRRFCEGIQKNLANLTFEEKRAVIEKLNVTALMVRNEEGVSVVLSGYFPSTKTDAINDMTSM